MSKKQFLLINRQAPYGHSAPHESLEVALAAGAYEQTICLLFIDDGVWQLSKHQQPQKVGYKHYAAILKALDLYNIEQVYVEKSALVSRELTEDDLIIPIKQIDRRKIQQLIVQSAIVLNF